MFFFSWYATLERLLCNYNTKKPSQLNDREGGGLIQDIEKLKHNRRNRFLAAEEEIT